MLAQLWLPVLDKRNLTRAEFLARPRGEADGYKKSGNEESDNEESGCKDSCRDEAPTEQQGSCEGAGTPTLGV